MADNSHMQTWKQCLNGEREELEAYESNTSDPVSLPRNKLQNAANTSPNAFGFFPWDRAQQRLGIKYESTCALSLRQGWFPYHTSCQK